MNHTMENKTHVQMQQVLVNDDEIASILQGEKTSTVK